MPQVHDHLVAAVHPGRESCVAAARAELAVQIQAWHCDREQGVSEGISRCRSG
jgi:hypothetical protein